MHPLTDIDLHRRRVDDVARESVALAARKTDADKPAPRPRRLPLVIRRLLGRRVTTA